MVDARHSRRGVVRQGREALAKAGANVLGAVVNRVRDRAHAGYQYSYGAAYGSEAGAEKRAHGTEKQPTSSVV